MVGRLHPIKDWMTFLKVAKFVEERSGPSCAFLVVGSGPEEENLRGFVNDNGLKQVFFLGYRPDIPELLQEIDVLLLTSKRETFPVILLEAMASGCPVVATRSGGPESMITHETDGLLCDIQDAADLSEQLLRLLADRAFRERIALQARKTVLGSYDLDQVSLRLAALYEDVSEHELF
jgi:glycosyltransferase involved in cell wall biosynthesis